MFNIFRAVCTLLSLVSISYAISLPHSRRQDASLTPAAALPGNWSYTGCYNDAGGDRTLAGSYTGDATGMNATTCIAFCDSKKYVYAGTEYSTECYCGNSLSDAATLQSDSSCSMACSGNSSEVCGGSNRVTVYYANRAALQGPVTNPGPPGWTSYGCWADNGAKTLSHGAQVVGGDSDMTVAGCTSACASSDYQLAGLEYAGECYCDNHVSSSSSNVTIKDCNMPCNGNSSEFCGSGNRMNLYAAGSTQPSVKPTSSNPVAPAPPAGWFALGCYNDSQAARTLSRTQYLQMPMTIEACTSSCSNAGYTFAGVEYSGECYCDSGLNTYAAIQDDGRCNMACNGNANETCGGPNGINVFQLTGWFAVGCWNDTVGSRSFENAQYGLGDLTIEKCTAACKQGGYVLAGMEYGNECYCDNAAQNYGGVPPDGNVGCNMKCQGDDAEVCGGPNRLSVYQFNSSAVPGQSPTSTVVGGGNGGGGVATPTPKPSSAVNATAILPFKYQGCYTDNSPDGRALTNQQPDDSNMTIETCIAACTAKGYIIAGAEYGVQCFCDNLLHSAPALVGDSDCAVPCPGATGEKCGAGSRLSLYSNGTMRNYTAPGPQLTDLPGSWTYKGCLTDVDGARSLPYEMVFENTNSNGDCLALCSKYGYNAGGTEYSQECYCGDTDDVRNSGATLRPESECNMVCAADQGNGGSTICGGAGRMSYYTWTGDPLYKWNFATGSSTGSYTFLTSGPVIPLITAPSRNGKVTYLEKYGTSPANNGTGAYEFDISQVGNYQAAWREMHVKSDIFCAASLTLPDRAGRQIDVGGWANDATYGVRLYWPDGSPGVAGKNDWQESVAEVSLLNGRWYPTAMMMANGSILVMGGEEGSNGAAVPTLEVLPSPSGEVLYCDYLARTDPNNLYPFLVVLPSGGILVAYYNEARILDPVSLQTSRTLPNIPGGVFDSGSGGRTYPFQGTAMVLPQTAPYSAPLQVVICGGSTPFFEIALDNCVTISPDVPGANWTIERMPSKRLMPNMVALPDGTYLILNGARQGRAGFGLATDPNLSAVLYDPSKPVNQRMSVMANTTIARLYHSEAVLLDDGRVLVSGSDPEDERAFAPQEYRNELFTPPYILKGAPRPALNVSNLDWEYGQTVSFPITTLGSGAVGSYRVSLIGAVASTHGNSIGQRTFFPATSCSGATCTVTAPPNASVCPPAWFQMFLLDANNIPSTAIWVRIGGDPAGLGSWPDHQDFHPLPGAGPVERLF